MSLKKMLVGHERTITCLVWHPHDANKIAVSWRKRLRRKFSGAERDAILGLSKGFQTSFSDFEQGFSEPDFEFQKRFSELDFY